MKTAALLLTLVMMAVALPASGQRGAERRRISRERAAEYAATALRLKDLALYDKADSTYLVATADTLLTPADRGTLLLNRCELYLRRGLYATADTLLSCFDDQSGYRWNSLKAATLSYRARYDEALALYDRLIDTYARQSSPTSLALLVANRGYVHQHVGHTAQALADLTMADSLLAPSTTDADQRARHLILANRALLNAQTGHAADALADIDTALTYMSTHPGIGTRHPDYIVSLRKRAEIVLATGDTLQAVTLFADYVERERTEAIGRFATMGEQFRLDYWKNKSGLIGEIFATEDCRPDLLLDAALLRRETGLIGDAPAEEVRRRLGVKGADVQRSLRADEVGIDFVRYQGRDSVWCYGAIVVKSDRSAGQGVSFVRLWTEDELNGYRIGRTTLHRAACSTTAADKNAVYGDSVLAWWIWQPLLPHVAGAHHVYFCPEGLLHLLAIEHLPVADLEPIALHRLTSLARLTRRATHQRRKKGRLLAVGGLEYDTLPTDPGSPVDADHTAADYLHQHTHGRHPIFKHLTGTQAEVAAIDSVAADHGLHVDTAYVMTETDMRSALTDGNYSAVHLSTHGYALSVDVPTIPTAYRDTLSEDRSLLSSGLALTGANVAYRHRDRDDGLLSARELCRMDLSDVDMVVLSACQTALGTVVDEGPAGLLRGLKKAGAGTVVATLWEVSDQATRLFMTYFYDHLTAHPTANAHDALCYARQRLRQYTVATTPVTRRFRAAALSSGPVAIPSTNASTHTPYADPYYWAAFIVIDDNQREQITRDK